MKKVLIVTGSGRSGTSSVAGTLKRLGFRVPQPEVEADERNPRGYYEPLWVSQFHKQWLDAIAVRTIDARPHAGDVAMADVTPHREEALRAWLADELADCPEGEVVVIKETRAYWVYPLWERVVAAAVGAELASLTMVRHPAQVVRSRDSAYLTGRSDDVRLQRETANVAAWVNSVVVTERATRGNPRAFVRYDDLIGDWRAAMTRACAQLEIDPGDLSAPHAVDDFVTPSLNRSADGWDGLTVPPGVRELADRTWTAASLLVATPDHPDGVGELDEVAAEYRTMYTAASAIASDEVAARGASTRRMLEDRLKVKNTRIAALRAELRVARGEPAQSDGPSARPRR